MALAEILEKKVTTWMFDGPPPTDAELDALWTLGYRVAGVYVGGPNLYRPNFWPSARIAAARAKGFKIVAFYVGAGYQHLAAFKASGLTHDDLYFLDVEGGAPATETQMGLFASDVRTVCRGAGLYSNGPTINMNWRMFDCVIVANYQGSVAPSTSKAPNSTADCPNGWQWRGTFGAGGTTIDASVVDSYFIDTATPSVASIPSTLDTGVDDLTSNQKLNIKRSMIWPIRLRHENWPPGQVDIDSFANQINDDFSNYEGVITALEQTFENNHQPSEYELLTAVRTKLGA